MDKIDKKSLILELTEEEMKWIKVALNREGDLQYEKNNEERAEFLYNLAEKFKSSKI